MSVAKFLIYFFSERGPGPVAVQVLVPRGTSDGQNQLGVPRPILLPSIPMESAGYDKTSFDQGFTRGTAWDQANSPSSFVQRSHPFREFVGTSKCPPPRATSVGRRSRITLPIRKAHCDMPIKQPYLYRCDVVDLLYRKFHRRVSERTIG